MYMFSKSRSQIWGKRLLKLSMLIDTVFDVPTYLALKLSCDTQQLWISKCSNCFKENSSLRLLKNEQLKLCVIMDSVMRCFLIKRKKYNLLTKQDVNCFMTLFRRIYFLIYKKSLNIIEINIFILRDLSLPYVHVLFLFCFLYPLLPGVWDRIDNIVLLPTVGIGIPANGCIEKGWQRLAVKRRGNT